jgi:hypothetical protein
MRIVIGIVASRAISRLCKHSFDVCSDQPKLNPMAVFAYVLGFILKRVSRKQKKELPTLKNARDIRRHKASKS